MCSRLRLIRHRDSLPPELGDHMSSPLLKGRLPSSGAFMQGREAVPIPTQQNLVRILTESNKKSRFANNGHDVLWRLMSGLVDPRI
jgi:hypothetical protein